MDDHARYYVVDIGNTSVAIGEFCLEDQPPGPLPQPRRCLRLDPQNLPLELSQWLGPASGEWLIGSVNRPTRLALCSWLSEHRKGEERRQLAFQDMSMPMAVEHPERVGIDRLAAALAASQGRAPDEAVIVVDAGSAITIDLVSAQSAFEGGLILPGMQLGLNALASGTDLLPREQAPVGIAPLVGKNTQQAMRGGVFWATLDAVQGIVRRLQGELGGISRVVLTGGDTRHLLPYLQIDVRYEEHLVLAGLFLAGTQARS